MAISRVGMKDVAARYPAFVERVGKVPRYRGPYQHVSHTACRRPRHFALESKEMLALSAAVARQSRGTPIVA